jgi:hypothetical protein
MMMINFPFGRGAARVLAVLATAGTLGACSDLLSVENPGAILEENLNDPAVVPLLVNSVVGDFQAMFTDLAYYSAVITDETVTGHNFETIKEIDLRQLRNDNGSQNSVYTSLQRTRFAADTISGRLRALLTNPSSDVRLARTLAYAGYTYTLMGEYLCGAPLNPQSAALPPQELLKLALNRFDEAIQIASASKTAGQNVAQADEIINLARVGAGRAALQLNDKPRARAYAVQVPATFVFWVRHSDNSGREANPFFGATTGSNFNMGVDVNFRNLRVGTQPDERVRHAATGTLGHNRLTLLFRPVQPPSFEEYTIATRVAFNRTTDVRMASGLEARYIVAEAEGPTAATLALVNERRKAAVKDPVAVANLTLSGDALMAELRDQRRRDFFLDGHRLGDLRRYKATGVGDFFPKGAHPNVEWGNYGTDECFLISLAEKIGNPNV